MRVSSESDANFWEYDVPAVAAGSGELVVMEMAAPTRSQPNSLGKPDASKPMPYCAPLYLLPEMLAVVPSSLPMTPPWWVAVPVMAV